MNTFFKKISIVIVLGIVGGMHHVAFPAKSGNTKALTLVKTIKPEQKKDPVHRGYDETVYIVGITPDGKFLICRRSIKSDFGSQWKCFIEIRDLRGWVESEYFGKVIKTIKLDPESDSWITPQGNLLVRRWGYGLAGLIDIDVTSKEEPKMVDIGYVFHPLNFISDLLIAEAYASSAILVYDMNPKAAELGKELDRICDDNNNEGSLAVASKRKLLFVGQKDGTIKILNMDRSSKDKKLLEKITEFVSHTLCVTSLTVTPDEKYLISCHDTGQIKMGDHSAEIKMWNINDIISKKIGLKETLLLTGQGMDGGAPYVTITPNGKLLIAREDNDNLASTTIKIFNIDVTSECFGKKIIEQNTEYPIRGAIVVTKDSRFLIATTSAQGIHCWQLLPKPSPFIAKDKILPHKQPPFTFPKLNNIKIHFDKKYAVKLEKKEQQQKTVVKDDSLVTVLDLQDFLKNLQSYTQDQDKLLTKNNNALLKNNVKATSIFFIDLLVSLESFFSYSTTLVETFPVNKMGIIDFVKTKCLKTIKSSLERTIEIYSIFGVRSAFLAKKPKAIQEALHKSTQNLLNAYALFTKKAGSNSLEITTLITSLETTYNQYVEKSRMTDSDFILKDDERKTMLFNELFDV